MSSNSIILKPRMSEKTYGLSSERVYVFDVDTSVNKHDIAEAVEKAFEVKVESVRTITAKGKAKKLYRNRRYEIGTRSDVKKAYVTLKEGNQIPIFAAVEEAEEEMAKAEEKADKKAEKKAKKEAKKAGKEK